MWHIPFFRNRSRDMKSKARSYRSHNSKGSQLVYLDPWEISSPPQYIPCCGRKSEKHAVNSRNIADSQSCSVHSSSNLRMLGTCSHQRLCRPWRRKTRPVNGRGCCGTSVNAPSKLWSCILQRSPSTPQWTISSTNERRYFRRLRWKHRKESRGSPPGCRALVRGFFPSPTRTCLALPLN